MLPLRPLACLATLALLSGCTFLGSADESRSDVPVDTGDYVAGRGVAVVAINEGDAPFTATWEVRNHQGEVVKTLTIVVPPGGALERRAALADAGPHVATLRWNWTADGRAASGTGEARFDTNECGDLSRLTWTFQRQGADSSATLTKQECV